MDNLIHLAIQNWKPKELRTDDEVIASVMQSLCKKYNLSENELYSKRRFRHIVKPRQIAMFLVKRFTRTKSLKQIGKMFGGFDHTSVIHSVAVVENQMSYDTMFKYEVESFYHKI